MLALNLATLCLAISGCKVEEGRLKVLNPAGLCTVLRSDPCDIRTASLVVYPNGSAELLMEKRGDETRNLRGHIDMLGEKTSKSFPSRFDFVTSESRVRFIQNALVPEIEVVGD